MFSQTMRTPHRALSAARQAHKISSRTYADFTVVTNNQGASKPIISYGPAGRSAVTGHVATVFGCTGFLGRYLVSKLAKAGTQVIVPYREEDEKRHLKVMGDLGQIVPMEWDIRNPKQIEECVRHSDTVYNLVGRDYETKNFNYTDVHVTGSALISRICSESGVGRYIQLSHLNASHDSESDFYRTRAEAEDVVKENFNGAMIVRPGPMFGHEDKLLNNMNVWPILWRLNHGDTKIRPVHVLDIAQVLTNLLRHPLPSTTLSLPGPTAYTYTELLDLIQAFTHNPPTQAPVVPKSVALAVSKAAQLIWWPALSPDEVKRRYMDDASVEGDWDKVGVVPEELENVAIQYLRRYRSAANFVRPVELPPKPPTTPGPHYTSE
jgi:NADH dehydrogenase (ubiquinone) 1 alpha subcomplex subunit 9